MRTRSWVLLSALSLLAGAVESACSSSGTTVGVGGIGMGGESGAFDDRNVAGEGGTSSSEHNGDAGADSGGASAGDGGESGASTASDTPGCVPTGTSDAPDDDFLDSNCDGIDGDASHAIFVSPGGSDSADGSL